MANSVPPGGQVFEGSSNNTYTTATPLTLSADSNNTGWYRSQVGYGSIDPANDQDWWSFTAQAGDHIDVRSGVNGNTSFNPYLALYRDNGTSNPQNVANDTRSGPGLDDYISNYTAPTTGTYYVQLSQYTGTGTYDLRIHLTRGLALESDAGYSNNSSGNALSFTTAGNTSTAHVAGTIMGAENSTPDLDRYQLGVLNAGQTITLATRLPNWTTLEPQVRVLRLNGSTPVYMADSDPSDGSFSGTADIDGTYYAEVYTTKAAVNGTRYTFNSTSQTWTVAEAAAVTAGGHLASVPNQQVQSALVGTFGEYSYWVGLNDAATEGTFVWSDGTPLTYTNWYGGTSSTANNTAANDYVAFDSTGGGWYVSGSGTSYRSVIEKSAEAVHPALSTAGVNAQYVLDVSVADLVPPVVSSVTALPAQGQSTTQLLSSFAVNFSEKLTVSTVTASAFDLRGAGADGQFDTADDVPYTLSLTYDAANNQANFVVANGPMNNGSYRLKILPTITDLAGNALGGGVAYTQTFTVANSVPPGGQVFEGSSNGTYATATPLTLSADSNNTGWYRSQVGYGSIDPSNDQDWWSFTAQAGDHIDVRSGVNGNTSFNPYLALYRDNGTSNPQNVANDTRGGPGLDDYISNYTVPTTGTYYVQLSQYIGTGTYDLRIHLTRGLALESDAGYSNGSPGGSNTVTFTTQGPSQVGAIAGTIMAGESGNVDKDYFNLGTIAAGQSVLLSVNLPTWSSLQPIVEVRDSSNQVVSIDTSPTGAVARADITTTGVYYADVVAFSGQGPDGQYVLNIANQATSTLNFADLQVASITPPTGAVSGSPVTISWQAGNFGAIPIASSTWTDRVYLSSNNIFGDADDISLGSVIQTRSLAVNETYSATANVTLPNGLGGNYYLFVQTDINNNIPEFIYESNNIRRSDNPFAITPAGPDLQVTGLGTTPASPQSGQQVTINWNDANSGTASTPSGGNFVDHVTVVNTTTGQTLASQDLTYNATTAGVIAAGSSAPRSFSFTLPTGNAGAGTLSIAVTTNSQGSLFEYNSGGTASNNNITTLTATATLAPYPDIQVTGLTTVPASGVQSGQSISLQWSDSNSGTAPTTGLFTDHIKVVNMTTGQTLVDADQTGTQASIATGSSAARTYSLQLADGPNGAGQLQITITADNQNNIAEYNASGTGETNNSALVTTNSSLAPYPDLSVSGIAASASAGPGQQVPVGWTLANAGNATAVGPWSEQVFLATDISGSNPVLLSSSTFAGQLAAGQSDSRLSTVQIPQSMSGDFWLVVRENPSNVPFEVNTLNNAAISAQPIHIVGGLTLTLANHSVSNNAGSNATTATITRNTPTAIALDVTIANSDPTDVIAPQIVTIPAGQSSAAFLIGTINNHVVEGTQTVNLTASANGFLSAGDTLTVTDVNIPMLTLNLSASSVSESAANPASTGTVTRNTSTTNSLVVTLVSDSLNEITVPATVTIPAGQASATFPLMVINDEQIDGTKSVNVTASAAGLATATAVISVTDANVPTLSIALKDHTVSESAQNPATTGTISIASPTANPITIALFSDSSAANVPSTVVIGAGQTSVGFLVTVVGDGLTLGDRSAVITAKVETNSGVILDLGSSNDSLLVKEADGPALSGSLASSVISKGAATTATVRRNTSTSGSLIVSLSASDPTSVSVPATVTIPAGQSSVTFTVTSIDDHTPKGQQHVQITASSPGLASAIVPLEITEVDLPDLTVSNVSAPTAGYNNLPLNISWTVVNGGLYHASGSWIDRIYLDPVGGSQSSTPIDSVTFSGSLDPGQSYTQTDAIQFPSAVGQYIVRVVTDANQTVQESDFANNTGLSQPVNDQPYYQVAVAVGVSTVSAGTPVPLSGLASLTSNGAPAVSAPVAVQISVAGTTRTLTATTDSSGHYSVTFQPLANEAGDYSVAAADPGVTNPAVQAHFTIAGLSASPAFGSLTLVPNTPLTGQITIKNLSPTAATGLTATKQGGLADVDVQLSVPAQISASGSVTLNYALTATGNSAESAPMVLHLTTAQGAVLDVPMNVSVLALSAHLAANPGFLNSGMVVGEQTLISFTVTNNGGSPSGSLNVSLPLVPYMALASAATIPSLAPGATSTITLQLTPAANLALQQYTGTIAISNNSIGLSVPFNFRAISTAVGDVHVLVDDDYTFQTSGSPHVVGATVNLLDPYDNTHVVATGITDAAGAVTLSGVPAGQYALQVQADGHSSYLQNYTVVPGITNNDEIFIARQFVTYSWIVQQTTIQDTYQIKLQTTFQTDEPAPVVTMTAPASIPTLAPGNRARLTSK